MANMVTGATSRPDQPMDSDDEMDDAESVATKAAGNGENDGAPPPRQLFGITRNYWMFYDLTLKIARSANAVEVG